MGEKGAPAAARVKWALFAPRQGTVRGLQISTKMAEDRASWAATVLGLALLALLAPPGRCEDVAPPYGETSAAQLGPPPITHLTCNNRPTN